MESLVFINESSYSLMESLAFLNEKLVTSYASGEEAFSHKNVVQLATNMKKFSNQEKITQADYVAAAFAALLKHYHFWKSVNPKSDPKEGVDQQMITMLKCYYFWI